MHKKAYGFTIVEVIIVIAVIAILATITAVSYRHIQGNAERAQRATDMARIVEALEIYRLRNNAYPPHSTNTNCQTSGWEDSHRCPDNFLAAIQPYLDGKAIVDPINNSQYRYNYHRYSAGSQGCNSSKGHYYVLRVLGPAGDPVIESSPGFSCPPTRNWGTESSIVKWAGGAFLNP